MDKSRYVVYEGWQVVAVMDKKLNRMVAVFEVAFHPDALRAAKVECKRLNGEEEQA
ncbi:MAG: hypothetical protein IJN29_09275 [Akkermansia sp.]|nr:hypothetical protein [Akkermansia sp.]